MKETFIDPLLHPYSASTPASPAFEDFPVDSPRESIDYLPIAARFLSPTPFRSESPTNTKKEDNPNLDSESIASDEEEEAEDRLGQSYSQSTKAGQMSLAAKPVQFVPSNSGGFATIDSLSFLSVDILNGGSGFGGGGGGDGDRLGGCGVGEFRSGSES